MKWPSTLKIGAHEVEVIFASSWDGGGAEVLGQAFPEEGKIYVREGMKDTQTFRVLFHEAMHFMNWELDHVFLNGLAEQISQFLFDNNLLDED